MNYFLRTLVTVVIIFALVSDEAHARPTYGIISRQKRVSDQRLAELETLLALSRTHGKLVTVPVAFGRIDPIRIGRRRRSSLEYDLQKLQNILQEVTRNSGPIREEDDDVLISSWQNENNRDDETEAQLI
ncbi:hypothetical protein PV326_004177 [Microctonus aethiopoides]|uniref:Uncharacterized protein n=1 Tax=Microctonus aethiopoides TaxID=144406 RepID=A0AA39KWP7_9HYME|nr:hypothetical protein PV326_004177 [Microctonus aethiopoides]KAK0176560.1 hypothetical protein PV328_000681 [Microctonus aethiopoides]